MKLLNIRVTENQFKPLLHTKNVQIALMVLKPNESTSDGVENEHPYAEQWLLTLSGSARATVGKRHVKLAPHSVLVIEKKEPHRITNSGRSDLVALNVYCPPAYSKAGNVLRAVAPQRD